MVRFCAVVATFAILAAPAFADPMQVKFAYPSAPNNALFASTQSWAEDVNKAADGAIEIKIFPGGVIGSRPASPISA